MIIFLLVYKLEQQSPGRLMDWGRNEELFLPFDTLHFIIHVIINN